MISGKKAMECAECPVCFDDLAARPVSVFIQNQRRICRHYFHTTCIHALMEANQMQCPICRAPFCASVEVPDVLANPRGWFHCVDFDGNGKLDQLEVLEVLKATLLVDFVQLEQNLPRHFHQWDIDENGYVSYEEMIKPGGVVDFARSFRPAAQAPEPPDIRGDRIAWFRYWDEDANGTLDMEEILRAFIKTFKLQDSIPQAIVLREILECLWFEVDPDGSGAVDIHEFCQAGGLADMILANLG